MKKQPNVIVFFTDQQRFDTSSLYGNTMDLTPNYDRMAICGTHCYNAFTPQPVCLPARSCLQTGLYASKMNIYNNSDLLPLDEKTMGQLFKQAGYNTGYIGKWHMCHENPVPKETRKGYDYWMGSNIVENNSDAYKAMLYDDDGNEVRLPGYRVDAFTDVAIDFVADNKDNPFFLFLSYIEPHFQNTRDDYPAPTGYEEKYTDPWTPPDLKALGGTSARHLPGYYGMVKRLDEALGRLDDALISLDIKEETIILFTSDHGCHFKTRNSEYKRSCHDSSIRIPMALTGSIFSQGGRITDMVSLIDMAPTLLDACAIKVPDNMDGNSILPLVKRQDINWPDYIYSEACDKDILSKIIRTKRWKYCVSATTALSDNKGKVEEYKEEMLFDLKADPWELNNVIECQEHRKVCKVLRDKLIKQMQNMGEKDISIIEADTIFISQRKLYDYEIYQ